MLDGLEDARNQRFSQRHALAVDVGIVAAREVDPLEAAWGALGCGPDLGDLRGPIAFDDEAFSWLEFPDFGRGCIEGGLNDRAFGGGHDDFIVLIPEAGTDAVRVAGDEGVPGADDAAHDIAPVPVARGALQDVGDVELVGDELADFGIVVAGILEGAELLLDLVVQEVADFLENGHGIGLLLGVLSQFHQLVEELVDVGQVEVAGQGQVRLRQLFCRRNGWTRSMVLRP